MGRTSHRFKKCAQRRRVLHGRGATDRLGLRGVSGGDGCWASSLVLAGTVVALPSGIGKAKSKVKFTTLFSKSAAINWLSAARLFLFCARDVWFVVGLPVFLASTLGWSFMAGRRFRRGMVRRLRHDSGGRARDPADSGAGQGVTGDTARLWALILT